MNAAWEQVHPDFVDHLKKDIKLLRQVPKRVSSPVRHELGALTKSGKTHGVRSFYSGDPEVISQS
jgi:hypothetical protein